MGFRGPFKGFIGGSFEGSLKGYLKGSTHRPQSSSFLGVHI